MIKLAILNLCVHRVETDQEPRICTAFQRPRTETPFLRDRWIRELCVIQGCCRLVTKLCLTLCDHMDCSLSASLVHGISQARILELDTTKQQQKPQKAMKYCHLQRHEWT